MKIASGRERWKHDSIRLYRYVAQQNMDITSNGLLACVSQTLYLLSNSDIHALYMEYGIVILEEIQSIHCTSSLTPTSVCEWLNLLAILITISMSSRAPTIITDPYILNMLLADCIVSSDPSSAIEAANNLLNPTDARDAGKALYRHTPAWNPIALTLYALEPNSYTSQCLRKLDLRRPPSTSTPRIHVFKTAKADGWDVSSRMPA
ncbi:hypothetical protein AZE42_05691 [Rhizopogon vesiculosus]|uniref:Uncharacterized protein n=1 Tax=Rhizopogon vesiculosus TaxID=180088 RepID=A0A1J8PQW0_9AGAM|nr:hypothetical protein AZE42_05691 [Rhizopogon vesiculosus]